MLSRHALLFILLAASTVGCADVSEDPDLESLESPLESSRVGTEDTEISDDTLYPESMDLAIHTNCELNADCPRWAPACDRGICAVVDDRGQTSGGHSGGCTGTVIGPYTVLTAHHCAPSRRSRGQVRWKGVSLRFDDTFPNTDTGPVGAATDLSLLFVPELTPAFLAEHGIVPARIDASADSDKYIQIGVASSTTSVGWEERQFAEATFSRLTPGAPNDGAIVTNGVTEANPGDSGGPTFGSRFYGWGDDQAEGRRHLVGVTQGNFARAPLAYQPGMTPTQRDFVRRNSLWVLAQASDIDGDGIPAVCDEDPSTPRNRSIPDDQSLCPRPLGGPLGPTGGSPIGLLECKSGYAASGIKGRFGAVLDQVAIQCRAVSCLTTPDTRCDEYWTDAFGGDGGDAFQHSCPSGRVLVSLGAHTANGKITQLRPYCANLSDRRNGSSRVYPLGVVGPGTGTTAYRQCSGPSQKYMVGLEARSFWGGLVEGLQLLCSDELTAATPYVGGSGGQLQALKCPASHIAVGTVQNAAGTVGHFGVVCAPRDVVEAQQSYANGDLYTVWASHNDSANRRFHPGGESRYYRTTRNADVRWVGGASPDRLTGYGDLRPVNTVLRRCAPGFAMTGITVRAGALVDRVQSIRCTGISDWTAGQTYTRGVDVGGTGGTSTFLACGSGELADGFVVRAAFALDGMALTCRQ